MVTATREAFYAHLSGSKGWKQTEAHKVDIPGFENFDFYVHHALDKNGEPEKNWVISEGKTGMAITSSEGDETEMEAIDTAMTKLEKTDKSRLEHMIDTAVRVQGISPGFKDQPARGIINNESAEGENGQSTGTFERESGRKDNPNPRAEAGIQPSRPRSESSDVHPGEQTERVSQNEEVRGSGRVLSPGGESSQGERGSSDQGRDVGERGLESGNSSGNPGEPHERLTPADKDIVLTKSSDIGFNAGAASRFDANLAAIRTLKKIEARDQYAERGAATGATPEEQTILAKYSGFGDSAFGQAFPSNEYYLDKKDPWTKRREELKKLTTDEEFKSIEGSRLNAFYTTPTVIESMWKGLERLGVNKLQHPHILEPSAGSGRFLGYEPADLAAKSERVAVELDSLTGRMLKQLYPKTETYVMGFEKAPIPKESVDVAISNVPFGNYPIFDPSFKKDRKQLTRSIHNYFFAKTLEELRPGGVLAFITSHNTMDAPSSKPVRQALAKDADFISAIRLPEGAFPDTKIVTDIIFMRKRASGETDKIDQTWIETGKQKFNIKHSWGGESEVELDVSKYFLKHPEMVMGIPSGEGSMNVHRSDEGDYTVMPKPGISLEEQLNQAIKRLPSDIMVDYVHKERPRYNASMDAKKYHEGSRVLGEDGNVYINKGGVLETANLNSTEEAKVKGLLEVRDAAKAVIDLQVHDAPDSKLAPAQAQLNQVYTKYVLANGPLSTPANADLLENDPDMPFLKALEQNDLLKKSKDQLTEADQRIIKILGGKTPLEAKDIPKIQMPIFTKRVIHGLGEKPITDYADAETVVKNETGRLDFKLMAEKLGKTEAEVIENLAAKRLIFKNPIGDWEPADQYLTGDVREKLKVAERAASAKPKEWHANVEALKAVQPADIPPGQIGVRMGAPWIPASDINIFTKELLNAREAYNRNRWVGEKLVQEDKNQYYLYNEITGEWALNSKPDTGYDTTALKETYGTQRINATNIILRILNGKTVEINDKVTDPDGKERTVRNPQETILAQEKAAEIQRKFLEWIWKDPDRAERLAKEYNEKFNNFRPRVFDGAHQELPGISAAWSKKMHPHQKDAIWRVVQDRTALLAHEVGFGKTAVMVSSGMELRRLGLAQKILYVVPKATHAQFRDQFLDIYPFANVLYPSEEDFTPEKRAEFISRAVTGDWDAILVSDSQFRKIPPRPETEARFISEEIGIAEEAFQTTDDKKTQKEIEKALKRLRVKLETATAKIGDKSDKTVYFEDIGIDQIYVDEADMYKNLHFTTTMGRIKGLPNSESDRAWDMYEKTRYLQENKNNGVVFATGTPVANTIAEMYTQMRYLQEPMLEAKGLTHFDAWAKTFGETTESLEQTPTGQYRMTQRFAKFANAPELSNMWQTVADIRVADEVPEMIKERPRIVDEHGKSKREVISVAPDQALLDYMAELAKRADELKNKDPHEDNMLKISSDARKASLDMRLVKGNAPFNPDGKVSACCKKVKQIYSETNDKKGTQLIFLDIGTPKAKDVVQDSDLDNPEEDAETREETDVLKDVYHNIKNQLMHDGVPENEIAFIHDAKNDKQRKAIQDKTNSGEIRVLIGSTGKLGTGLNVQRRAAALHHLDAPWRPRDIEQREGRIVRQGNEVYGPKKDAEGKVIDPGPGVKIYTYVTERSFDAYMWQAIEAKSKAIKAIMRRSAPPRSIEDIDSFTMSAGEAKAVASGNPDVLKEVTLKNSVNRLQMLRSSHLDSKIRANGQLKALPAQISQLKSDIENLQRDSKLVKEEPKFGMKVKDKVMVERPEAGDELVDATKWAGAKDSKEPIAEYRGFKIKVLDQGPQTGYKFLIYNPETNYEYATSNLAYNDITGLGSIARIDNRINAIKSDLERSEQQLKASESNVLTYQKQADAPFEYEDRLSKMEAELTRLQKKLQGEEVEEAPESENYVEPELPEEEAEPAAYHFGEKNEEQTRAKAEAPSIQEEQVNPVAEVAALKAEVQPVEKTLEVKAPALNIETIVEKIAEPATAAIEVTKETQSGAAEQVRTVVEPAAAELGNVGDKAKIMGVNSILADSKEIAGVRYDVFKGENEPKSAVRITDVDSGEVLELKQHPKVESAEKEFKETTTKAEKLESSLEEKVRAANKVEEARLEAIGGTGRMKLLPKALESQFPGPDATDKILAGDKIVIAKYFHPLSNKTWYAVEYDPDREEFFGYVDTGDQDSEWGFFSLSEMNRLKVRGLGMERDLHFTPKRLKDVSALQDRGFESAQSAEPPMSGADVLDSVHQHAVEAEAEIALHEEAEVPATLTETRPETLAPMKEEIREITEHVDERKPYHGPPVVTVEHLNLEEKTPKFEHLSNNSEAQKYLEGSGLSKTDQKRVWSALMRQDRADRKSGKIQGAFGFTESHIKEAVESFLATKLDENVVKSLTAPPNKYFVYEGDILRAAQSTKEGAEQFMEPGRELLTSPKKTPKGPRKHTAVQKSTAPSGPLTTEERNALPASEFAEPEKRKYPIEDESHAHNALARVSQFGTTAEKEEVKKAVAEKYPEIRQEASEPATAPRIRSRKIMENREKQAAAAANPPADLSATLDRIGKSTLKAFEESRSNRSRAMDERRTNKTVIDSDNPRVQTWMHHPGQMDILGVDTAPGVTQANSFPKVKLPKVPKAPKAPKFQSGDKRFRPSDAKGLVVKHMQGMGLTKRIRTGRIKRKRF